MNALSSNRLMSSRGAKSRPAVTSLRYLNEIERECADIRQHVVLRVREQTAEALLQHVQYEEVKRPLNRVKDLCSTSRRKKKTRSSSRRRAAELQQALVEDAPTPQRIPALFSTTSAPIVEPSSNSFTASSGKKDMTFKSLFRRYAARSSCGALEDLLPPTLSVRSARSFVGEQYRSVETF